MSKHDPEFHHVVVIPDTQYPFIDRKSEAALMNFVDDTQPDRLVHIGDLMDFYSLSRFQRKVPPKDRLYLHKEIERGRAALRAWSGAAPKAEKVWIAGNHEQRLETYLETHAPELYGLDDINVPELLHAKEFGWRYLGPYGAGMWLGKPGGLWATHGQYVTEGAPKKHVEKYGHSIIYGHTHRLRAWYRTDAVRSMGAWEVGTLCNFKTTPRTTPFVDWQHGFADVWVSTRDKRFDVHLVKITNGACVVGGRRYHG